MVLTLGFFNISTSKAGMIAYEIKGLIELQGGTDLFGIDGVMATLLAITDTTKPASSENTMADFSNANYPLDEVTLTIGTNTYNAANASPIILIYI